MKLYLYKSKDFNNGINSMELFYKIMLFVRGDDEEHYPAISFRYPGRMNNASNKVLDMYWDTL